MSRPPLRLLHCSDSHFHHARAAEALATARALCATAAAVAADGVLLAGDVFDAAPPPPAFVDAIARELLALGRQLVAIPAITTFAIASAMAMPSVRCSRASGRLPPR